MVKNVSHIKNGIKIIVNVSVKIQENMSVEKIIFGILEHFKKMVVQQLRVMKLQK